MRVEIRNIFACARAGEREQRRIFLFARGQREKRGIFLFALPVALISSLGFAGEFEEQRAGAAHD